MPHNRTEVEFILLIFGLKLRPVGTILTLGLLGTVLTKTLGTNEEIP
jgi:hypothetical protein